MSDTAPVRTPGKRVNRSGLQEKARIESEAMAAQLATAEDEGFHEVAPLQRTDLRGEMRPQPSKAEDSRARAAARAAQLLENGDTSEEGKDKFFVDPRDIPPGWSYEWKRFSVYGAEDPSYQVQTERAGWEPVPASRHPHMMPVGGKYQTIERDGMVLMERPAIITEKAKKRELANARAQMRGQEAKLNEAPTGQFERHTKDGSLVKIDRSYERIEIPE
jgi:hypothetical protein